MRFSDAEAGSQLGTFLGNLENVSAGRWFYTHTEIYYSLCPRRSPLGKLFFWGVVATCPKSRTGYHSFPQFRAFTPHYWLPAGYHPESGFRGVFPDVTAWADTRWTWKHGSEKWELLSGSDERAYFPS